MDFSTSLYEETTDPTASENFAGGYVIFDRWLNTSTQEEYLCVADGVWKNTTSGGTGGTFNPVITSPTRNDILQYIAPNWVNKRRYDY
jgi:hypothetical protein